MTTHVKPVGKPAEPPVPSPSGNGRDRANENRTTHNQSVNTDSTSSADGAAEPRVEPQLPHDIDESAHSQARGSERQVDVGEQAYKDTVGPAQDTDRGVVTDALYNQSVAPDRGRTKPRK